LRSLESEMPYHESIESKGLVTDSELLVGEAHHKSILRGLIRPDRPAY
jgi:hypothetical protein